MLQNSNLTRLSLGECCSHHSQANNVIHLKYIELKLVRFRLLFEMSHVNHNCRENSHHSVLLKSRGAIALGEMQTHWGEQSTFKKSQTSTKEIWKKGLGKTYQIRVPESSECVAGSGGRPTIGQRRGKEQDRTLSLLHKALSQRMYSPAHQGLVIVYCSSVFVARG